MSVALQSPLLEAVPTGVHQGPGILFFDGRDAFASDIVDMSSPELEQQLMSFGFWKVGEIAAQPFVATMNPGIAEDADEFDPHLPHGSKNGVLISDDQSTFAEPEFGHGAHHLRFRTLLKSGDIVETRWIPTRTPMAQCLEEILAKDDAAPDGSSADAATVAFEEMMQSWLEPSDEDAHPSYPRAGLWRTSAREPNVARLWEIHQEWLSEVVTKIGSQPVRLVDTAQILQMTRRAWHIVESHSNWSRAAVVWIERVWKAATVAWLALAGAWLGLDMWFALILALAALLTSQVTNRVRCRPLLGTIVVTVAAASFAVWHQQPLWASIGLVLCFGIVNVVMDFLFLVFIAHHAGALTGFLPWPRRIEAAELADAYPDPEFPDRGRAVPGRLNRRGLR